MVDRREQIDCDPVQPIDVPSNADKLVPNLQAAARNSTLNNLVFVHRGHWNLLWLKWSLSEVTGRGNNLQKEYEKNNNYYGPKHSRRKDDEMELYTRN